MRKGYEGNPDWELNPQKQAKYTVEEFKAQIADFQAEIVTIAKSAELAANSGNMKGYEECQVGIEWRTKEIHKLKEYARRKEFGRWVKKQ